jgi:hypothetical protein
VIISIFWTDCWRKDLWEETTWANFTGYFSLDLMYYLNPWRKFCWMITPRAHVLLIMAVGFTYMSFSFVFAFTKNVYYNTSEVNKVKKGYYKPPLSGITELIHEIYGHNNNIFDIFLPTDTRVPPVTTLFAKETKQD